jgi:hypothetical protein
MDPGEKLLIDVVGERGVIQKQSPRSLTTIWLQKTKTDI